MSNSGEWSRVDVMSERQKSGRASAFPARGGSVSDWQRWTPYAAVVWSLVYAALGLSWVVSGQGFPYVPGPATNITGPLVGRFGEGVAWAVVIAAGLPAAVVGTAMLRGVRVFRPFFIAAGGLLGGFLLLLMIDVNLLALLGYTPYGVFALLTGAAFGQAYLR